MEWSNFKQQGAASKKRAKSGEPGRGFDNLCYWWEEEREDERAQRLCAAAKQVKEQSTDRHQANLRHARLYGNFDQLGFGLRDYQRTASSPLNKIALNVVASCVDTLTGKIAKNCPRPSFQTSAGNYKQRMKAKDLDKFCRGLFYEAKVYKHTAVQFLDACWAGTGFLKVFLNAEKRVRVERTLPDELYVDDADGIYDSPRQLFQRRLIAREVLLADPDFTDNQEKIAAIEDAAPPAEAEAMRGFGDVLEVWEAWHLPSSKGAKDGMHAICIEGVELYSEPWKHDFFPFVKLQYKPRIQGFWGQGLAEELAGLQMEINRLLRSVSDQLRRKGRGRIFLQAGSKVSSSHITNAIADIVHYNGNVPPIVDSQNAVAAEEFMQLDRLVRYAYQIAGISELSAGSKKPSGLDAAVALREFSEIESERFSMTGKRYETIFLDLAEMMISLVRETSGAGYKVKVAGKRVVEELDWKDIQLEAESYTIQMFPVSSLPQTPSARRQTVKELMADGFLENKAEARALLDFPDLEADSNLATAAVDDADACISAIIDEPVPRFMAPDEHQNLQLVISRARAAYLRIRHEGADEKRLDMLRRLIDSTAAIELKSKPMPQPQAPAAPMMPGAPAPMGGPLLSGGLDITNIAPPSVQPAVPPLTAPPMPTV